MLLLPAEQIYPSRCILSSPAHTVNLTLTLIKAVAQTLLAWMMRPTTVR